MEVKRLHTIAILVDNLEEAVSFYEDVLGLKRPGSGPYSKGIVRDEPGLRMRIEFVRATNDTLLELVEPQEGPRLKLLHERGAGTVYRIGYLVDDIEKAYEEIR